MVDRPSRGPAGRDTVARLLDDVAAGIRVLSTRDGVALNERQVWDRARNIVAGLVGNYRIVSFDDEGEDAHEESDDEDSDDEGHNRFPVVRAGREESVGPEAQTVDDAAARHS